MLHGPIRIVILVGSHGRGSNMQAIIEACVSGYIPGEVVGVISTAESSPALTWAAGQGIPTLVAHASGSESFDAALLSLIQSLNADLVVLAGFMKLIGAHVVRAYSGRMMNIHPALIPSFCGKGMFGERVHQAVLDAGVRFSGCTVHFVDEHYDTGPIILQAVVPVEQDDTAETLAGRVLEQEHRIYPEAVKLFAEGRLVIEDRRVRIVSR